MAKRIGDLTGKRFGKLLVTRLSGKDKYYDKLWECLCDCGNSTTVRQGHLLSGHTTSCGCKKPQLDDLSGQRFEHLQVQYRTRDYVGLNGKHYVQ